MNPPGLHFPAMQRTQRFILAAAMLGALAIVSCTNVNTRLNPGKTPLEVRRPNQTRASLGGNVTVSVHPPRGDDRGIQPTTQIAAASAVGDANDDGHFVGIAISGGGSRFANFAAAAMFQLQKLGLLQKADYISSVSGGSMTAAYYCVSTDDE